MEATLEQRKLPKTGFQDVEIQKVIYIPDKEFRYKTPRVENGVTMTSFKTDVLRLVFRVSNTKEENDGQYDFEVFMLIDKFPNTLYKRGQTTVKDCKFITKILIKAFGEEAFPDVVYRNKVDWESLKTVKLTANIEHVPHYKLEGILVADIDNVSPPASEEARAHNKTRAQMFFAHVNDKEYKSPEIGTKK